MKNQSRKPRKPRYKTVEGEKAPTYPEIMHAIQHAKDRATLLAANEDALAFAGPDDQKRELANAVVAVAEQLGVDDLPSF